MEVPKRKQIRLPEYDFRTVNAYFVTICTKDRKNLFWENVGASIARPQDVRLSAYGEIVDKAISEIGNRYPAVSVDKYVIMPNHIHLLLQIHSDEDGRPMVAPTLSTVVQQMKGAVSKQVGFPLWQKGFYDHVVRGDRDYQDVWTYIEGNPMNYLEDTI